MTLKGSTKEFPLETLLRLLHDTKKTGELTVRGPGGEGALGLADGRVVTAMFGGQKPIPALGAVFKIGEADFEFMPWDDAPPANLEGELEENLKRAEEYAKWLASVREVIPHDGIRFRLSERAADQGAVTFTADRWRVVMAVNTQPDVNELAANLHIDRDEALTTLAGLVRDGVIDTVEAPAPAPPQSVQTRVTEQPAPAATEPPKPHEPETGEWSKALLPQTEAPAPPPAAQAAFESSTPASNWSPSPMPTASAPEWTPAPRAHEPQEWSSTPSAQEWSPTIAEAAKQATPSPEPVSPPMPQDWGAPSSAPAPAPVQEHPMPREWDAPAPAPEPARAEVPPAPANWDAPQAAAPQSAPRPLPEPLRQPEPEPEAPPVLDDRLAALQSIFDKPAQPPAPEWTPPAPEAWTTPAPTEDEWGSPNPAPDDPRLAAMQNTATTRDRPAPRPDATPDEWAPPPSIGAPARQKKGGLFGGLLGRREEPTRAPAAPGTQGGASASTRTGQLAAFSNALLTEYNSGQYGKGRVEDRIPSLLMRVDEQADPIDRPLPVVDDRLDVQALERVSMSEKQAVPYLALLVATIYADAEKAFGKDKAKRGYKTAQQQVFGGDTSALSGSDVAGKLPKV